MFAKGAQAPEIPTAAIVGEVARRDRNEFPRGRRAAGEGEHVDFVVGQEGAEVAALHFFDVGLDVFVWGDGNLAAEVLDRADLAEMMITTEAGVGLKRDD